MKKLLNTLFVTSSDSYLSKDGANLVVSKNESEIGRLPIHNVQQVICFGHSGASPSAMRLCIDNDVTLSFMSPNGRFLASVYGETKGNVLLRRKQYRMADDKEISLNVSKNMILGKIINCRSILKKGKNDHNDSLYTKNIEKIIDRITYFIENIDSITEESSLRGIEGDVAHLYFQGVDNLILKNKEEFFLRCRNRRPPRDRMNSLLSFLYSMLMNDVKHALESVGLDSYVGFLHTDRPGRPSLALDLMEELRPIADRVALTLVNLRMISPNGFIEMEGGAIIMDDDTRRTVIEAWQSRKSDVIFHPYIKDKVQIGLIPFIQALLLSRYIRGDIDGYPPFILKQAIS